ncbi:oxidoreductase [Lactiplantibacillus plantarum]|nr:oxidoreductase [Lactiplantibacillus plantarum]
MKTIDLGYSHLPVSNVALGIMRMDALDVAQATTVLDTAADLGINYIDSADIYGGVNHPPFLVKHSSRHTSHVTNFIFNPRAASFLANATISQKHI